MLIITMYYMHMSAVRVVSRSKACVDGEFFAEAAITAARKRLEYFADPTQTDAYRVINGENDYMGGKTTNVTPTLTLTTLINPNPLTLTLRPGV